ncbi:hypothetical protein NQ315_017136 [Exocentrus adspersus]|uniref:Uncharacterized protein n=1 Tax=Exocentrus adspersus TaxID=1586481 RepID=A0AAV8VBS1_9CUCU|nr:hypothetical protein NQ315_017136 [Exocentrus adspersus]
MCKHIHLVAMMNKTLSQNSAESGNLEIVENQIDSEAEVILQQVSKPKMEIEYLEIEKRKLEERLARHIRSITSPTKLRLIKKLVDALSPTLAAVNTPSINMATNVYKNPPHNKNINTQRRLWCTKKRRKIETTLKNQAAKKVLLFQCRY